MTSQQDDDDVAVSPDYGGAWLGTVLPALQARRSPPGLPGWVAGATPTVLLLIDGLGARMRRRFAAHLPALDAFTGGVITSVVPSTTAAALPSLTTGRTPAEHGMLGDRIRVGGTLLNVLRWTVPDGQPPDATAVQPHLPFGGGPVGVVTHATFRGSGFSRAHLRGAAFYGYDTADQLVERVAACVRDGLQVMYAYLPDIDRVAHERGLDHPAFGAALTTTNRVVEGIRRVLPRSGAVVVTSDHGHVTVDPDQQVDLTPLRPMVSAMAGSTRLRYLHARPGATRDLLAAAAALVGSRAWVHDRAGLVATGWLGNGISPIVAGRLGDVVLAARGAATMVDPDDRQQAKLVTMHGSLTAGEMLVPLLAAPGERSV